MKKTKHNSSLILAMAAIASISSFQSQAVETNIQIHKGSETESVGYSIGIADRFSRDSGLGWDVSYNRLSELKIKWNNDDLFFDTDTVDLMATYQFRPKSYGSFVNRLIFEAQVGASFVLTENKFVWPDLDEEKTFSEQGDVNPVVAALVHYKFNKKAQIHLGFKYYPQFSEFDGVGSVFFGATYKFGKQVGY